MTVRRLAAADIQPAGFAFSRANAAWARQAIRKYPKGREQSAVIPLLMRAQEQEGWVTKAAIEHVADMLDMPYIRVLEVATFYTQYQLKPVGTKAHVQVCGTTPCMLRGSEALIAVCREKIHSEPFHANAAGTLSWEEVECLGACVNAPMVMIFKDAYEDLTPERLGEIIDVFEAGRGASVPTGPQNGRVHSAPISGLTSLTDEKALLKSTRDREARRIAREEKAAKSAEPPVAPSQAARPRTDAIETSPAIKSPSRVKASPAAEAAASAEPPREDRAAANRAEEAVEKTRKQRHGRGPQAEPDEAYKAPETLQEGEPIGPSGRRRSDEAVAEVGSPSPEGGRTGGPAEAPTAVEADGDGTAGLRPSLGDRNRPAAIGRPDRPDDLKLISGIGPKNERMLHELGVYTFAQVAAWKAGERDWVDSYLKFKGRIEREDWVGQAKALAKGGEAEYIRVFGRKPR